MELSQGKQSKSGKKREEKGKDRKKEENGGVELFDCFAFFLPPPNLIFTVLLFFFSISHNMGRVWVCECRCAPANGMSE